MAPDPRKRPKSSYIRFVAAMPSQTWQSDFTHYRLPGGADVEIITWLDDCTRYALHVTAHHRITGPIAVATFRQTAAQHGIPTSILTDNGMVFTTRLAGRKGGRNALENQLRAQPVQPATLAELQQLLDAFVDEYNPRRPHRSLPHRATPAARYDTMPGESRDPDTHDRIRHDRVDKAGSVTLRHNGRLHHIDVGRTHAGTCIILLIQDLDIRVVNTITGELLRELTLNTHIDYQPTGKPKGPTRK